MQERAAVFGADVAGMADVIVIGGGVAGLSAAASLAEHGERVVLLEARPELGGRTSTYPVAAVGSRADNGQHVLMGCYDDTFAFLRRIGAAPGWRSRKALSWTASTVRGTGRDWRAPRFPRR